MPNPVVHWEVTGQDAKRLQDFYTNLFDWHVDADNPMNYGLVDTHAEGGINGGSAYHAHLQGTLTPTTP